MYREGQKLIKQRSSRIKIMILVIILAFMLVGGFLFAERSLKPNTYIKQSSGYSDTARYDYQVREYSFPTFSIKVPNSWTIYSNKDDSNIETAYAFRSTSNSNYQTLQLFIDKAPSKVAVSKVLVVSAKGDSIVTEGSVSDNCAYNQDGGNQNGFMAKWQNISYLCDSANAFGSIVGISSADSLNSVNLASPSNGQNYKLYVKATYSDMNPDYSQMINALKSIRVK